MAGAEYATGREPGLAGAAALLRARMPGGASAAELAAAAGGGHADEAVARLRGLGYGIEGAGGVYRLASHTWRLLPWEVAGGLRTERLGRRVIYMDSVGSTQAYALGIAGDPAEDGTLVAAGRQTAGAGRGGRGWESPEGGVWISVVLCPGPGHAELLPLAAAVALAGAAREEAGVRLDAKWPNDLLLGGRKVAGIVVDASATGGRTDYAVVGVGMNYGVPDAALAGVPGAAGVPRGPGGAAALVRSFLLRLERELADLGDGGLERRWAAICPGAGAPGGAAADGAGPGGPRGVRPGGARRPPPAGGGPRRPRAAGPPPWPGPAPR